MYKYFTKTFFKLLGGFLLILFISIVIIFTAVQFDESVDSQAQPASDPARDGAQ